jgi:hypothetical protein
MQKYREAPTDKSRITGSLQLSQLGLNLSIVRLSLGALQDTPSANVLQALQMGYEACLPVVEFLEMISDADAAMFWIPCKHDSPS